MWNQLIYFLFTITNVAHVQSTTEVAGRGVSERYVHTLLRTIHIEEALPVIYFAIPGNEDLQPVTGLVQAEIFKGRLVSGTKFYLGTSLSAEQTFFCQNPNSTQTCLVPQNFPMLQTLECEIEPNPVLQPYPGENNCGADNSGNLLSFNYELCPPAAPYNYTSQSTSIYMICYDSESRKNLYVSYTMYGTSMLKENLLIREREVNIPRNDRSFGYIDPDYYNNLQTEANNCRKYVLQTLVPPEDMPLAALRKATHYYANHALQHTKFTMLWNAIRGYIRDHAAGMITQILTIKTGVFDIPVDARFPTRTGNNEMKTIWVTRIITTVRGNRQAGLAILMNNFTSPGSLPPQSQYIDHLCGKISAFCEPSLHQQFVNNGGAVRCCMLTQQIMNLFSPDYSDPQSLALLRIRYII